MDGLKKYGAGLAGLLIALIVLAFVLKLVKKAPLIGGIAGKAEELAHI